MSQQKIEENFEMERTWIERSKKDIAHFRPLYDKYHALIHRYIMRRTDDENLAADLCSTTFLKAIEYLPSYKWTGRPFGAWLYRIAQNEVKKHFRDKKPVFVIELDKIESWNLFERKEIDNTDFQRALINALDDLKDKDLYILELRYFEELSFSHLSGLLDISESAVKMRVYRILNRLKEQLQPDYDKARF